MRLLAVRWQRWRRIIFFCSQSEQGWAPEALHLHGPSPNGERMAQTTRQGGAAHLGAHTGVRKFGGCGGGAAGPQKT